MSTKVKLEDLRNYIKEIIKQELKLQEASTTGAIDGGEGPPKTPNAFQGKRKKDKEKESKIATNSTGYKKVNEIKFHVKTDFGSVLVDASGKGDALIKVAKALKGGRSQIQSVKRVGVSQAKQVDKKIENVNEYWWDDLSDKDKEAYIDKHGEAPKRRGSTKDKVKSQDKTKSKSPEKKEPPKGKHFGPRKKKSNPKKWNDVKPGDKYKLKSGHEVSVVQTIGDDTIQVIVREPGNKKKRILKFAAPGKNVYPPGFNPKTANPKDRVGKRLPHFNLDTIDSAETGQSKWDSEKGEYVYKESVNEGKYHDYRNDESLTPKQKIGYSMREVRDKLNELDKLVKMNVRLKNEVGVDSTSYWKRTHGAMKKISERLVKLANKVGQLY
jgi:hypothetical protein